MILNASLDTSFWVCASQIGIVPYLFDYFKVHYCTTVEKEIVTTDASKTSLVYPQAQLFLILQEDGRLHRLETTQPLKRFGAGEAYAIALALEHDWTLLINDRRPLMFARALGLQTLSIPSFCVFLYVNGKITESAVHGYLKRLTANTSPVLIDEAKDALDKLNEQNQDK